MTAAEAPINESMNPSGDEIAQETLDSNDTINNDTSNKSHPTHKNNPLWLLVLNSYSTVVVFVRHLFSIESFVGLALSVIITVYLYEKTDPESFDGAALDWVLLTFAVVTPITSAIGMAFQRREKALQTVAALRATAIELYGAHASWGYDIPNSSSSSSDKIDRRKHSDEVLQLLLTFFCQLTRYLTMPNFSRARHKVSPLGEQEVAEVLSVCTGLEQEMMADMGKLSGFCEKLKSEGLLPQEAIRIRQWERIILTEMEHARMIKCYRTPQGLRSFGRLFSVFLPPFYSPYSVQIGRDMNSLGYAIAFACCTSIALTALFELVSQMEDPFVIPVRLDGIHMDSELLSNFLPRALRTRKEIFPRAPSFVLDSATLEFMDSIRIHHVLGTELLAD